MLEFAYPNKEKLQKSFESFTKNDNLFLYFFPHRFFEMKIEPTTEQKIQLVSIDKSGEIKGFFSLRIDWNAHYVSDLTIIRFDNIKSNVFSFDLIRVLYKAFCEYNFNKIKFKVIVGHPIEKSYDRIVPKFGGRIVGVFINDIKLLDGRTYDYKHYEIIRTDFLSKTNTSSYVKSNWDNKSGK